MVKRLRTPKKEDKTCTWKDCKSIAKHQQKGSLIALCDKHESKLDNDIQALF